MWAVSGVRRAIVVVAFMGVLLGCSGGSGDQSALKAALGELTAVAPPAGAEQQGQDVRGCRHDSLDGNEEPNATADFRVAAEPGDGVLDGWYLPKWKTLGWADVAGRPGVVERTIEGEVVQAYIRNLGPVGDRFVYSIVVGYADTRCD